MVKSERCVGLVFAAFGLVEVSFLQWVGYWRNWYQSQLTQVTSKGCLGGRGPTNNLLPRCALCPHFVN